jgi:hypothetical protein
MGRDAKLRLASTRTDEDFERQKLERFAELVTDEAHWQRILADASDASREELERVVGPMLSFRKCLNKECTSGEPAIWLPVLLLRAYPGGPTSRQMILGRVCTPCKDLITVEDVLTDDVWIRTVTSYTEAGKPWPYRPITTLTFEGVQ